MTGHTLRVDDGPVFFPLLDMAKIKIDHAVASKAAGEQDGQQCTIAFTLQLLNVRAFQSRCS